VPELPEVETVVRVIRPLLKNRRIVRARFSVPRQLLPQTPAQLSRTLRGQSVADVRRRAKFILIQLDRGTLLVHLRMTGRLYVRSISAAPSGHERAWLELEGGDVLVFHDPRTLGTIRYFPSHLAMTPLAKLGIEPLEQSYTPDEARALLKRRATPIKPVLLDQKLWAGIGNIYASEILWEASIRPQKRANALSVSEIRRLQLAIPKVLKRALERGGSTLRNFASPDGIPGAYQREFRVYDRADEPCLRCQTPIRRIVQAQRSTYYCSRCQK
jgi:formamidopyrimidine-DNA glycosylase